MKEDWPFWQAMRAGIWLTVKRGLVAALVAALVVGLLWLYFNNETANLIMTWTFFVALCVAVALVCAAGIHGAGEAELQRREDEAEDLRKLESAEGKEPFDHVDDGGGYG